MNDSILTSEPEVVAPNVTICGHRMTPSEAANEIDAMILAAKVLGVLKRLHEYRTFNADFVARCRAHIAGISNERLDCWVAIEASSSTVRQAVAQAFHDLRVEN